MILRLHSKLLISKKYSPKTDHGAAPPSTYGADAPEAPNPGMQLAQGSQVWTYHKYNDKSSQVGYSPLLKW